jgi:hypothetical protein
MITEITVESKARDKYLQRKYGITLKQYNKMLRDQKQSCAICKKHKSKFKRSLAVDHNHATGKVRSLLCFYCNKYRVGRATLESAKAVYEYLLKYESFVPES